MKRSKTTVQLMRDYVASLEQLRPSSLVTIRTIFSKNMLDADQVIEIANQFGIQYSFEAGKLFLSDSVKQKVFSLTLHTTGKKPLNIKEFRRMARLIGAKPILF